MSNFSKAKEPGKPTVFLVQENPYINVLEATDRDWETIILQF